MTTGKPIARSFATPRATTRAFAAAALVALATTGTPRAEEAKAPASDAKASIIVCDDLITLRRLMADVPDQSSARGHLSEHAGCREVPAGDLGEVERRTMVGGVPYECRKQGSGACAWVLP